MVDREEIIGHIQCAELAGNYEEMVQCMKELIQLKPKLNTEELNWLSLAYDKVVGSLRATWFDMSSNAKTGRTKMKFDKMPRKPSTPSKVENDIRSYCTELITMINEQLMPNADTGIEKVMYYKLLGEFNHYLAETESGAACLAARDAAIIAYSTALILSNEELSLSHPTRLSLALNFASFRYDVLNHYDLAYDMAESVYNEAMTEVNVMDEDRKKEVTPWIKLIRDNLNAWDKECKHRDIQKKREDSKTHL